MSGDSVQGQFVRYALVGLASNALLYVVGVLQTFLFNKRWSFRHGGMHGPAFVRYCAAYVIGYVVNFVALLLLVDRLGWPHQLVQGVMIVLLALMLFALQKFWVFRPTRSYASEPSDARWNG